MSHAPKCHSTIQSHYNDLIITLVVDACLFLFHYLLMVGTMGTVHVSSEDISFTGHHPPRLAPKTPTHTHNPHHTLPPPPKHNHQHQHHCQH